MNWSTALRDELSTRAKAWAQRQGAPHYLSLGREPTVLFEPYAGGTSHGNFHPESWKVICAKADWARRLEKPHQRKRALPIDKQDTAKELDSCNSSDALLMNCFCFPGVGTPLLGGSTHRSSSPVFGIPARLWLADGRPDATELDMRLGGYIVEAKLTEADFTARPEEHVLRYKGLASCFDVSALPRRSGSILGYQLIRNVLAAAQLETQLVVLIDARRPDLLEAWWRIHATISDSTLRGRCGFRTWQEVAANSPSSLREFLHQKYGL